MTMFAGKSTLLVTMITLKLVLVGHVLTQAKQATSNPATPRQAAAAASPHRGQIDMYLAKGVFLDNETELELAKLAQTRAQSKDIVKFSEKMIEDHELFAKDLGKFVGPLTSHRVSAPGNEADGERTRRETATNENDPPAKAAGARPPQPRADGVRTQTALQYERLPEAFVQIHEEIAKECREERAQHELLSRKGAEFDECYLGMQLGAHMKMINVLKVFERHASPELVRVLEKGRESAQKHFDRAKEIMKDLEEGDRRETASEK